MSDNLKQDLSRFFRIYQNRVENLTRLFPPPLRSEWEEEVNLLRKSVLNRVEEEFRR